MAAMMAAQTGRCERYQEGVAQVPAQHDDLPLSDVERLRALEDDHEANGDEGVHHAQRQSGDDQLEEESHWSPRPTVAICRAVLILPVRPSW